MNTLSHEKRQILDTIHDAPVMFGHWVGLDKLGELHNDWLKSFLFGTEDQTLQAHRGSYKTTVISLFLALHILIEPYETADFFRKTDTDVAEVLRQVANILHSDCFQYSAQVLYEKEMRILKETTSEIETSLHDNIAGQSQILGLGIGASITGKHAHVVVTDDIVNLKDRVSPAERERTKSAYMELQNVKNRGGRFINCGTPWQKEDAFKLMPNIQRFDCYHTNLITKSELQGIRASMTDSLFAANYELKHIADKDAMFKNPKFTDKTELIYNGIAHIDAAYGGEDWTAYTIINKQADGSFVALGKTWQKHVDDCLDEIQALHEIYRAGTVYEEKNADKGYLDKELKKRGFLTHSYQEKMNKYLKISTYLRQHWSHIYWLDETDPEYLNMILDYTEHAQHDDPPDSAASLIRVFEKPQSTYHRVQGGL